MDKFKDKKVKTKNSECESGNSECKNSEGANMKSEDVNPEAASDKAETADTEESKAERAAKAAAAVAAAFADEGSGGGEAGKNASSKDAKIEELTDMVKRNMAEFDNFRKRTEKEKGMMFDLGARNIVEKLLPVIDNFERALKSIPEDKETEAFAAGIDMIYKQMLKNLEEAGVKPIECIGLEFDPNLHNAVMHVEDENFGENIVAEELQKGYMFKDTVVRHSMVKVAN